MSSVLDTFRFSSQSFYLTVRHEGEESNMTWICLPLNTSKRVCAGMKRLIENNIVNEAEMSPDSCFSYFPSFQKVLSE